MPPRSRGGAVEEARADVGIGEPALVLDRQGGEARAQRGGEHPGARAADRAVHGHAGPPRTPPTRGPRGSTPGPFLPASRRVVERPMPAVPAARREGLTP